MHHLVLAVFHLVLAVFPDGCEAVRVLDTRVLFVTSRL